MIKDAKGEAPYEDGLSPIIARDTLAKDLLLALLDELKHMPDVWQKLSAMKQDDIIERLRKRVVFNVEAAVSIIAASQRVTISGVLAQVTLKDGIKAVFEIPKDHPNRHQFMDCMGSSCMIVVADADALTGDVNSVKGDADQKSFFDDRGKREVETPEGKDVTGTAESNVHPLAGISFVPDSEHYGEIVDGEVIEGDGGGEALQPGDEGYIAPLEDLETDLTDGELDDIAANVGEQLAEEKGEVNPLDEGLPPAQPDDKTSKKKEPKAPKEPKPKPVVEDDFGAR